MPPSTTARQGEKRTACNTPTSSLLVSLGVGGWPLGHEERRCWASCPCCFQDFQLMWSRSTNVTARQRDGQTTCNLNTALYTI